MEFHELANLFPMMSDEEMKALRQDMRDNGYRVQYPVLLYEGKILDGRNRYTAATAEGIEAIYGDYQGDNALQFVISANLHRRHLSAAQRASIAGKVANMKLGEFHGNQSVSANLQTPKTSQAQAAEMMNVSPRSVATAKEIQREAPEVDKLVQAGSLSLNAAKDIARMSEEERAPIVDAIKKGEKPHVAYNGGQNEWYTPSEYIKAAKNVFGTIDLDPASSDIANKTVKAKTYYTKQDNGLEKEWRGNVWMNPPYSSNLIIQFVDKLSQSFESGDVKSAIVLVNNATETRWFGKLIKQASAVVFTSGRVKFLDPQGSPGAPLQGQAIVYLGDNPDLFISEFSQFGWGALCAG
jgi:phage N-6-adenine-methyltransferase